ncbi:TPA: hypothetical protein ACOED5_002732 [Enterobacter kobei]
MECKVSDLVKRGHDQAAELKSSCGAVDVREVAQLISDLATHLDVQLARSNALAAENAGLKVTLEEIEVINRGGQAYCVKDGMSVNPIYARGWNDYRAKALSVETPATDDFLAEVRAQGVEMFASKCKEESKRAHSSATRDSWWVSGENADDFASQLRKGVQS